MSDLEQPYRISQIHTLWTVVGQAGGDGTTRAINAAQEQLLERYGKAVYRYLLGAIRDTDVADELYQEFALRFVRGDLAGADPQRGRFRDYLKGVLSHLVGDHYRRKRKQPLALNPDFDPAAAAEEALAESDAAFQESWRNELLGRAWSALAQIEKQSGQPFHTVLQYRAAHPEARSEQMAIELSQQMAKQVNAAWVRQTLHRAREKFAELLLDEVLQTLRTPTMGDLEQELIDIGLIEYCRPALEQMRG
jgi:RNA polymerase sigma factor (sigma-70 family)